MGISRTAYAAWGGRLELDHDLMKRYISGDFEESITPHVILVEWGSRQYGGAWGILLVLKNTYKEIPINDGGGRRVLPVDRDWNTVDGVAKLQDARDKLGRGASLDSPGWCVCGAVS